MNSSWLLRRVHPSWLLAAAFFGVILGVIESQWAPSAVFSSTAWLLIGAALLCVGLWKQRAYCLLCMCLAGGAIGVWRGSVYQGQLAPYKYLMGEKVVLQGKVSDDADVGKHGDMALRLSSIIVSDHPLAGSVWVSAGSGAEIKRGDIVTVRGALTDGFGSFAASMYRAEVVKVERPVPGDVALKARDWFSGGVRRAIPDPEASLGVGYLVGQRRSLPEELDQALKAAGLTHVVVASGYNLTILVGAARRIFARVSKFLAAFFSSGLIVGFMAVTGMSPSMSRAGLVTGLSLLAWYYGRRFHPLVLLPFAAAVTLLINPSYGYNDLGWQLSFSAFAGVLVVAPLLQNYFFGEGKPGVIRQVLGETVSAWVCTVPLIVLAFGQFSNVAILANLLILPLVPLAMLLTFVAGVGALLLPALATIVGLPALLVLGYMTKTAIFLGNVSWARTELTITPYVLVAYYLLLVVVCGYMWHKTRFNFVEHTDR